MEQLSLAYTADIDHRAVWLNTPSKAFENWQRSKDHTGDHRYAERSVRQHCAMWNKFLKYLEDSAHIDAVAANSQVIAAFLDTLESKKGNNALESTKIRYLRLFAATYNQMIRVGARRADNPCPKVFSLLQPRPEKNPSALVSQQDEVFVAKVLSEPPRSWRDVRDQAMLVLIVGSGLYSSEVINLRREQICLEADPPYIDVDEHGRVPERKAPILPFAVEPLKRWLELRDEMGGDDPIVFISGRRIGKDGVEKKDNRMLPSTLYRKVKDAIEKNSGPVIRSKGGVGPQVLRNSFLMRQLAKDKPIDVVQQWAGHVLEKSTMRFQRLVVNPRGIRAE